MKKLIIIIINDIYIYIHFSRFPPWLCQTTARLWLASVDGAVGAKVGVPDCCA